MVQTAAVIEEQADHLREQVAQFVVGLRSAGANTSGATRAPQSEPWAQEFAQRRAVGS